MSSIDSGDDKEEAEEEDPEKLIVHMTNSEFRCMYCNEVVTEWYRASRYDRTKDDNYNDKHSMRAFFKSCFNHPRDNGMIPKDSKLMEYDELFKPPPGYKIELYCPICDKIVPNPKEDKAEYHKAFD